MLNKKNRTRGLAVFTGVVLIITFLFLRNMFKQRDDRNAVMFSNPKEVYVSESEYDYFYNTKLLELLDAGEIEINKNKPLSVQFIDNDTTIHDYLSVYAMDKVRYNHAVLSYIDQDDHEWVFNPEEGNDLDVLYDEYISKIRRDYEKINNVKKISFENYLKDRFGSKITEDTLKEIFSRKVIVDNYIESKKKSIINDKDVLKIYNDNEDLRAKKYMFYDIKFNNLEEKKVAEEIAFKIFDTVVDEETFVDAIKVIDKNIQDMIKLEEIDDEGIKNRFTNVATNVSDSDFTNEWLFSKDENGEMVKPKSSAILLNSIGKDGSNGLYRVIYFIENISDDDLSTKTYNFDKVYISKKIYKDKAEEVVVDILQKIDQAGSKRYDEEMVEILEDITDTMSKDLEIKFKYRDIEETVLRNNNHYDIIDFLNSSKELDHTTIEGEDGYTIIINRGNIGKVNANNKILEYIKDVKMNEFLKDVYVYAKDFKLVVDGNKKPYIDINMNIYKDKSIIEKVLNMDENNVDLNENNKEG